MPESMTLADLWQLAPEVLLTTWGLLALVLDFAVLRRGDSAFRRYVLGTFSVVGALLALAAVLYTADFHHAPSVLDQSLAHDAITSWFDGLIAVLLALVLVLSLSNPFTEHWGEYYALVIWAAVGMMVLIAATELISLFLALEMMTICLYLLTAFVKTRRRSAEGGLKYFVYGSVSSALFLFGLSLLYGLTGTTRLEALRVAIPVTGAGGLSDNIAGAMAVLLVLVGFGFKVAAVPFHQWAPDAYEGAPSAVTAWISTGSKVASFIALLRVVVHGLAPWAHRDGALLGPGWVGVLAMISAASMTYGNFAALAQTNLKRLLAYSSIAHAGYLLVGVLAASVSIDQGSNAAGAVLFYLMIYATSKLGAFALATWLARDLGDEDLEGLDGLGYRSPLLSVCVVLLLLSFVGVPPLAGFFGKLSMFMESLNTGPTGRLTLLWLVALALANSVLSAFYYTRILKAMFLRPPPARSLKAPNPAIALPILICTAVLVGLSIRPSLLFDPLARAAGPLVGIAAESVETADGLAVSRAP